MPVTKRAVTTRLLIKLSMLPLALVSLMFLKVGFCVGLGVRLMGDAEGEVVCDTVGELVGEAVGDTLGVPVGADVLLLSSSIGTVGDLVGPAVRPFGTQ